MWTGYDNILIWQSLMAEAHVRKGISDDDLEVWHKYMRKYNLMLGRLVEIVKKNLKMDDEFQRISNEVDDLEGNLDKVKKKAMKSFVGFTYPVNENGIIFAFGRLYEWIEPVLARALLEEGRFDEVKFRTMPPYPDGELVRGDKKVRIEFETHSRNFKQHAHDPEGCDLIVCWIHDWPQCPIKVLELRDPNMY